MSIASVKLAQQTHKNRMETSSKSDLFTSKIKVVDQTIQEHHSINMQTLHQMTRKGQNYKLFASLAATHTIYFSGTLDKIAISHQHHQSNLICSQQLCLKIKNIKKAEQSNLIMSKRQIITQMNTHCLFLILDASVVLMCITVHAFCYSLNCPCILLVLLICASIYLYIFVCVDIMWVCK